MLVSGDKAQDAIVSTEYKNLELLPSNMDLAAAEIEMASLDQRESRLKEALAPIRAGYDYIFIDCPPSLGLITTNALNAADTLLIPIQCEYYALEGLSQLMNTVRRVKRQYNDALDLEGVLLTMYDGRLNLTQQVGGGSEEVLPPEGVQDRDPSHRAALRGAGLRPGRPSITTRATGAPRPTRTWPGS